jgi:hypothetical protein
MKKLFMFLFIGLSLCFVSLSLAVPVIIDIKGSQGAIFPIELAPKVLEQCSRQTPSAKEGFWVPTESQVRRLESLLPNYVSRNPPRLAPDLVKHLSEYNRQYIGVLENGKKIIYVNFFIKELYKEKPLLWQEQAVIVCDGGEGFWGIEFNVESEKFSNLITNGVA